MRPEVYGAKDMWAWQSPSLGGLQLLRAAYEIIEDQRTAILWSIDAVDLPDYGEL